MAHHNSPGERKGREDLVRKNDRIIAQRHARTMQFFSKDSLETAHQHELVKRDRAGQSRMVGEQVEVGLMNRRRIFEDRMNDLKKLKSAISANITHLRTVGEVEGINHRLDDLTRLDSEVDAEMRRHSRTLEGIDEHLKNMEG